MDACPTRASGVKVSPMIVWNGLECYVMKHPSDGRYLRIGQFERAVWELLDGRTSLNQVATALGIAPASSRYGEIVRLVRYLEKKGFLRCSAEADYPASASSDGIALGVTRPWWLALSHSKFSWNGADSFFERLYRHGGRSLYGWAGLVSILAVSAAGLFVFLGGFGERGPGEGLALAGSLSLGLTAMGLWGVILAFLHEVAHAMTLKHFGGEVRELGFMIYYGAFVPFTNTSDAWMLPRGARFLVSAAGPLMNLVLGGLASLMSLFIYSPVGENVFLKFATVAYLTLLFNLNPLMEYDGYYMLMDIVEIPNLRRKALEYWRKLPARLRGCPVRGTFLPSQEWVLILYGPLALAWTILTVGTLAYAWDRWLEQYMPWELSIPGKVAVVATLLGSPFLVRALRLGLSKTKRYKGPPIVASLLRHPGRSLAGVLFVMFGVVGTIVSLSLAQSITATFEQSYGVLNNLTILQPLSGSRFPEGVLERAARAAGADRTFPAVNFSLRVPIIEGMPETLATDIPVLGLDAEGAADVLRATGNRLEEGRLPQGDAPEISISRAVARRKVVGLGGSLRLGDPKAGPLLRVVGIFDGGPLLALMPRGFAEKALLSLGAPPGIVVLPADPQNPPPGGKLRAEFAGEPIVVWDFERVRADISAMTVGIRMLAAAIVLIGIGVILLLAVLLELVFLEGRLGEYSLLVALGFPGSSVLRQFLAESASLGALGWMAGVATTRALLGAAVAWGIVPVGLMIPVFSPGPYAWSALVPVCFALSGFAVARGRLGRVDHVSVLEGRIE